MNKGEIAVFLDRDGTLIEDVNYLKNVEDIKLIDGTAKSIKKLNDNNILALLVTNQSGVARGYFTEDNVHVINNALANILKDKQAYLDEYYYCPHHMKGNIEKYNIECDCRKPKTGMIKQALENFNKINLNKSYVIGDKAIDIELARNAGCKGILVKTGYGAQLVENISNYIDADYIAENINDAVDWILNNLEKDL